MMEKRKWVEDVAQRKKPDSSKDKDTNRLLQLPRKVFKPCRSVSSYEKLNVIEEGTYGVVSRAREISTGKIVALKKLKYLAGEYGFPISSIREIQTLRKIKHPNIVELIEIVVGSTHADIYLVMEFVEHDLYAILTNHANPFSQSEIKSIMMQLVEGTYELHRNWILHRDLKTANLLMTKQGQVKIADFGLSTLYGNEEHKYTAKVVTLNYRAPEVFICGGYYSAPIDMWAVGCIFAELLNNCLFIKNGKQEISVLQEIFRLVDVPTEESWPEYFAMKPPVKLPEKSITFIQQFPKATENAIDLLTQLLTLNPRHRITANKALQHDFFYEDPKPKKIGLFSSFPSRSALEHKKTRD